MKRIEMVDKIQDLLETQSHYGTSYRTKALEILNLLEALKMRPPSVDSDKCQAIMHVYYEGSFNMWDEDFEADTKLIEAYECRMNRKLSK